ncbi:hypothetical protein HDU84_004500 [Entophlyctis sp. JEL0112]|nr:hypothetical protein HDU84_004500 [Entophlyctis sp. JEL0112]
MFKKTASTAFKSTTNLRASDFRKLKDEVALSFALDPASVALLFGDEPVLAKSTASSETTVYVFARSDIPLLIRFEARHPMAGTKMPSTTILAPTLQALRILPTLLPSIVTPTSVARRLVGGADLMAPGVQACDDGGRGNFSRGDCVAIRTPASPEPVAVAIALLSKSDIFTPSGQRISGLKGKAFAVVTVLDDALCHLGSVAASKLPSAAGFLERVSSDTDEREGDPIGGFARRQPDSEQAVEKYVDACEVASGAISPIGETVADDDFVVVEKMSASSSSFEDTFSLIDEELVQSVDSSMKIDDESVVDGESMVQVPKPEVTIQEMDLMLEKTLLTAIKVSLPDDTKAYPMLATTLYSQYMLPLTSNLDVRHSSHKKLAKFMKVMEKKGVFKLKERQGGDLVVISINRAHPDVTAIDVDSRALKKASATKSSAATSQKVESRPTLEVIDLFKSNQNFSKMWIEVGIPKDMLFTRADLKEAMETYIKDNMLVNSENPRFAMLFQFLMEPHWINSLIKIDANLAETVLEKDEHATVDFLTRDAIFNRICDKMIPYHSLTMPGHDPVGRKLVTRISGIEAFAIDPEQLASELKVPCASSTTVADLQGGGANSGKVLMREVVVQGNKVHEVCMCLRDRYGFPFKGGSTAGKLGVKGGSQCKYVETADRS